MFPAILHFGPVTLHTYGLLVAAGIFAGLKILTRQAALDGFSGKAVEDSLYSLAFYLIAAGIFGARILYAATHWDEFSGDFLSVFKIWQGGLVFYGGLLAAVPAFFLWFSKHKALFKDWKLVADWVAPALAFGHAFGRLGCFAAGCCFGTPTSAPWAVVFSDPECLAPLGIPVHPAQIYESAFLMALGAFLLLRLSKARQSSTRAQGTVFSTYALVYSLGRFGLEFFRGDEPHWSGLSPGQISGIAVFFIALAATIFLTRRSRKNIISKV